MLLVSLSMIQFSQREGFQIGSRHNTKTQPFLMGIPPGDGNLCQSLGKTESVNGKNENHENKGRNLTKRRERKKERGRPEEGS